MDIEIDDETLVAYLDGELASEKVQDVELRLHQSEQLRTRMQSLRATWDLLTELPEEKTSPTLTQTTIEMIALSAEGPSLLRSDFYLGQWLRKFLVSRWLWLAVSCCAMLGLGAVAGKQMTRFFTDKFRDNLATIAEYRTLKNIESVEWLERLSEVENLIAAAEGLSTKTIGDGQIPDERRARDEWIEALGEQDRGRLEANLRDFFNEPPERKTQLQALSEHVYENAEDKPHLLETLRAYDAILTTVGRLEVARLASLPIDERLQEIEQRAALIMLNNHGAHMSTTDKRAFAAWIDDLRWDSDISFLLLGPDYEIDPDKLMEMLTQDSASSAIRAEQVDQLFNMMSPTTQALLNSVSSEAERRLAIGFWSYSILRPEVEITQRQMEQAFSSLKPDTQAALELMNEEIARSTLRQSLRAADASTSSETGE